MSEASDLGGMRRACWPRRRVSAFDKERGRGDNCAGALVRRTLFREAEVML